MKHNSGLGLRDITSGVMLEASITIMLCGVHITARNFTR